MPETKLDLKKNRLRSFFLLLEKGRKKQELDEIEEELIEKGLGYRQMSFPVSDITPEYENKLKEKVEHNFLHAKIREATEEDLPIVIEIYNKSWLTSHTPFSALEYDSLKKIYEYPDTIILIARVYGIDGAFVILDFEGQNKEFGVIAGLGVLPRFQRKGLGTIIGMAAWNYFKKAGVKELHCEVYVDNITSYNFIKSLGFKEGELKIYRKEDFNLDG